MPNNFFMNISELHSIYLSSTGVSTDTRSIKKDNLFFALSGENFNGNKFAEQALENGASYAVIDDPTFANDKTILVEHTLKTLQNLANFHRKKLKTPIIALTGSNGKTTTKELFNTVLSTQYKTTATIGNLNNHIGVPLTLLQMTKDTEIGIVEMGANHLKEIELLCNIAEPDYGYITNFGKAHLEGFGSLQGVIKGKSELYNYLRNNNKNTFLNLDDTKQVEQSKNIETVSFSQHNKECNTLVKLENCSPNVVVNYRETNINSNLIGKYNFTNIAAAICVGEYFKISSENIKKGIENYIPNNNRSQIIEKNNNKIILDAYNANPTSMLAALENLSQINDTHKTVFLGDMFELGKTSLEEHQKIVNYLENSKYENIYILGKNFKRTNYSNKIIAIDDYNQLKEQFKSDLNNQTILIKGSRGMALERILELL